ncbi:MAG: CDP-glycerol glycerophosphotransferase family protein, partial [Terracoccus sp.]
MTEATPTPAQLNQRTRLTRLTRLAAPKAVNRLLRKSMATPLLEYRAWVRSLPIDPEVVLYESFAGNGMLCNPEAIFRELYADPQMQRLTHVWVLNDVRAHRDTVRAFKGDGRVRFVQRSSPAYYRAVATAGVLINNATFPADVAKRPGQIYLNTWHGTPLKAMGYDESQGAYGAANTVRNFLMADYLLSTSQYMSEVMYEGAYRMGNIAVGELVETGYPRTDHQFVSAEEQRSVRRHLRSQGVMIGLDETMVLYAPTWKGTSFHQPVDDADELAARVVTLEALLPAGHRVLVKTHQQVFDLAAGNPHLAGRLVPNSNATNDVLATTDVLVTDYSSIFFDFLSTGRPILFHTPDREDYDEYRGRYLTDDELPGPSSASVEELAAQVAAIGTGGGADPVVTHGERYARARDRFAPNDDGGASRRVIDLVFHGLRPGSGVRPTANDGRQTLLVYLGGMMSNGITSSALNLISSIDHSRYDVSVLVSYSQRGQRRRNLAANDPCARQIFRIGGWVPSKRDWVRKRRLLEGRLAELSVDERGRLDESLRNEWR